MRILLSNDDGIDAEGIKAMEEALREFAEVWVVAPISEQSAKSHALTMHKPLRVEQRDSHHFAVGGTPVDCAYMAIHHFLPEPPDLVVSGVNRGANLGDDIHYSGTVAAAREACLLGYPALAVSLHIDFSVPNPRLYWETVTPIACHVAKKIHEEKLPPATLVNLNVPNIPPEQLKGLRTASVGKHHYHALVDERKDPRGKSYFWLGGLHHQFGGEPNTDGHLVEQGYAAMSPIGTDVTRTNMLGRLSGWERS